MAAVILPIVLVFGVLSAALSISGKRVEFPGERRYKVANPLVLCGAWILLIALKHGVPLLTDSNVVRLALTGAGWTLLAGCFIWGSARELAHLAAVVKPTPAWSKYVFLRVGLLAGWATVIVWVFLGSELRLKVGFDNHWLWVVFLLIGLTNVSHFLHGELEARDEAETEFTDVTTLEPGEE